MFLRSGAKWIGNFGVFEIIAAVISGIIAWVSVGGRLGAWWGFASFLGLVINGIILGVALLVASEMLSAVQDTRENTEALVKATAKNLGVPDLNTYLNAK
jgi:divalent metal cation (Fe/Co/Zn/Cd) transporter